MSIVFLSSGCGSLGSFSTSRGNQRVGVLWWSPTSSVVFKGKIPDREAKVFHMTETNICLRLRSDPICFHKVLPK